MLRIASLSQKMYDARVDDARKYLLSIKHLDGWKVPIDKGRMVMWYLIRN